MCLGVLAAPGDTDLANVWLIDCRQSFTEMIADKLRREAADAKKEARPAAAAADAGNAHAHAQAAAAALHAAHAEPAPLTPPPPLPSPVQRALSVAQPDELIDFRHLRARRGLSQLEVEDAVQADLARATGACVAWRSGRVCLAGQGVCRA